MRIRRARVEGDLASRPRPRPRAGGRLAVARSRPGAVLLAVAMLLQVACSSPEEREPEPRKVTIGVFNETASASVFVAQDRGFFRDEGLECTLRHYPSGKAALADALSGAIDFATVAETPVAASVLRGGRPAIIATIAEADSNHVVIGRKDRGVGSATDLKGKRVGVPPDTTADFFLYVYLLAEGLRPSEITRVELPPGELVGAVSRGEVDAISTFVPYTVEALDALGTNATLLQSPGLYTMKWNIATRQGDAETNGDLAVRVLRALARAESLVSEDPEAAITITSAYTKVPKESVTEIWPGYRWESNLTQTLLLSLEDEARWLSGGRVVPDFRDNVILEPLRAVAPSAVTVIAR